MFKQPDIAQLITSGVSSLSALHTHGQFLSFASQDPLNFEGGTPLSTTFASSLILQCLQQLDTVPKQLTDSLAQFLLSQKTNHWSYNYWTRESREAKETPYPDDLDDTFCALAALTKYDSSLISGDVMANIVLLLTATEVKEGGPYRTWLVPETAAPVWKDIDVAVNANIAYFLTLHEISLPKVERFIEKAITTNSLSSPYYASTHPIVYFISRFYKGKKSEMLKSMIIKKRKDEHWENPLQTALAIISLLNLGESPSTLETSIKYLIAEQKNGTWNAYPFYIDRIIDKKPVYVGSQALTSAFCLEAIALFNKSLSLKISLPEQTTPPEILYRSILSTVMDTFSQTPEVHTKVQTFLPRLLQGELAKQITLLPYYFSSSLKPSSPNISQEVVLQLGVANTLGWIAYTIYDDFLDNEGDVTLLGVANMALRELTLIFYEQLPENEEYHQLVRTILSEIDEANTWEVLNCRFIPGGEMRDLTLPDYVDYAMLAKKSLGHILGPLTILFMQGYSSDSDEVQQTLQFFRHYLIARQLDDDAHDWEKDFEVGQLSPVVTLLLRDAKKIGKNKQPFTLEELQELFWMESIVSVCSLLDKQLSEATTILSNMTWVRKKEIFYKILQPIQRSVTKAKRERENALLFIQTYK